MLLVAYATITLFRYYHAAARHYTLRAVDASAAASAKMLIFLLTSAS